jgi:hypothetical protein
MDNCLTLFSSNNFIDKKSVSDFDCPICYNIMIDVYETNACGHLYCKSCISKLDKCAICMQTCSGYHESKYLQRKLFEFKVSCCNEGCTDEYL